MTARTRTVAVVGAGLAGLACARVLAKHDVDVVVFDKGRSPGGRLTTRRVAMHAFDLGAQYFTSRSEIFASEVQRWRAAGVCAPWTGAIVALEAAGAATKPTPPMERLVGTPGMSAVGRHLAESLDVRTSHRVDAIAGREGRLELRGTVAKASVTLGPMVDPQGGQRADDPLGHDPLGAYDAVVVCLPASQAAPLLQASAPALADRARAVTFDPCVAVGFAAGPRDRDVLEKLPFDGAFIGRQQDGGSTPDGGEAVSSLGWVARDSSKPGRPPGQRWVLHATAAWSRAAFKLPESQVTEELLGELSRLFGLNKLAPEVSLVRRWALARAPSPLSCNALFDEEARIGLGGDWAARGRVEGAFLSGLALADRVLGIPGTGNAGTGNAGTGRHEADGVLGERAPRP